MAFLEINDLHKRFGSVDVLQHFHRAEALGEIVDLEERHPAHPLTAPAISPRTK